MHEKPRLNILLAGPRGFCAGVDRAIKIVEEAIRRYGAPVYVRHEIVHNRFVVESLERQGAVFVEELDEVPDGCAGGVLRPRRAEDACRPRPRGGSCSTSTPPARWSARSTARRSITSPRGHHILLIGHAGHPEVVGTMGQLPDRAPSPWWRTPSRRRACGAGRQRRWPSSPRPRSPWTTPRRSWPCCSDRFPGIAAPAKEDICYATTNRQAAVKAIAGRAPN